MDTRSVADELRAYFDMHPEGLVCAWLFGSVARGTARPDSDVDVAVLYERDPPETLDASAASIGGDIEAATALLDRALTAVTSQAYEEFLKRLDRPADPGQRLRRTMRTRAPWQTR